MNQLIAIIGPTATGKTETAIKCAQQFSCEIVNADSRQIYRYMDIGTAKPTIEQRSKIPHHLIDIIDPDQSFSLAQYRNSAYKTFHEIWSKSSIPLLVGGSGLYVWSLIEGWNIPSVPPNFEFREQLTKIVMERGTTYLHNELSKVDLKASLSIMPTNARRIIRALEIFHVTGKLPSDLWKKSPPPFKTIIFGLTTDRVKLYERVDGRVDQMFGTGFVEEVKSLISKGYGPELPSMSGIGYRQVFKVLQGILGLSEAISQTKYETHRFVRHQYAWFKLKDERIHWFDVCDNIQPKIENLVKSSIQIN